MESYAVDGTVDGAVDVDVNNATNPSPDTATTTTTKDQNLSELLRAMTTTTTIETAKMTTKTTTATATATETETKTVAPRPASSILIRPLEESLPTTISRSYKIFGISTHVFCQVFSDRIVVGVTQLQDKNNNGKGTGHIGSWVYCQASKSEIDPKQVDYELSTLLGGGGGGGGSSSSAGGSKDEKEIYARRIAERLLEKKSIPGGTDRIVILLGISLLPASSSLSSASSSIERFKVLVEVLVELIEEAVGVVLR